MSTMPSDALLEMNTGITCGGEILLRVDIDDPICDTVRCSCCSFEQFIHLIIFFSFCVYSCRHVFGFLFVSDS